MAQYIDKAAIMAEIDRLQNTTMDENSNFLSSYHEGIFNVLSMLEYIIDTLEVKDANEALRTEYEKGRADVIADTLSWLANVWPQYCSNPNIIDAYKEGVVKD